MYWQEGGRPDGPPVLLLHGLGSSAADWIFQLPALAPRYRVIAPDLPGHWRSALPPALTVEAMAREVQALLDHLVAPAVHAVGLSLGACVALALALAAPARVRSLTLVNGFARLRPAGPGGALRGLARLALLGAAPMRAVAALIARDVFPEPGQAELRRRLGESLARTERRAYWAALRALARFDARADLGRVGCPTLVVAGELDRTVPLAAARALADGIPGARLVVIPGSRHVTPADQPEAFNRALGAFLGEVERRRVRSCAGAREAPS